MDTTSNTLSRILHLLSQNTDVQSKLRQELLDAHAADGLSYDELNRLPLLDSVCRETLRRSVACSARLHEPLHQSLAFLSFPPVNILFREYVLRFIGITITVNRLTLIVR